MKVFKNLRYIYVYILLFTYKSNISQCLHITHTHTYIDLNVYIYLTHTHTHTKLISLIFSFLCFSRSFYFFFLVYLAQADFSKKKFPILLCMKNIFLSSSTLRLVISLCWRNTIDLRYQLNRKSLLWVFFVTRSTKVGVAVFW